MFRKRTKSLQGRYMNGAIGISRQRRLQRPRNPVDLPLKNEADIERRLSQVTKAASLWLSALDQSRIIGHMACAPSQAKSSRGYLLDWALVELDMANDVASQPTIKVYIGHGSSRGADHNYPQQIVMVLPTDTKVYLKSWVANMDAPILT